MFRTFDRALIAVTAAVVVALAATMVIVVLAGVFFRYVLVTPLAWSEELARYAMVWLSWIGGGLALRRGAHIATDLLVRYLPDWPRKVVAFTGSLLTLGFLIIVVYFGWDLASRAAFQRTSALGISMQIPYAAAPVGALLMIYHLVVVTLFPSIELQRDAEVQH